MARHLPLCLLLLAWLAACFCGCRPAPAATAQLAEPAAATSTPAAPEQAVPVQPVTGLPIGSDGFSWWNDSVFYEIFVRSFYDSNGDGIGDFNGLAQKLDYLNDGNLATTSDLGVTALWLMPIFPSPTYHGYDVTDYFTTNPDYGTLDDFKRLLKEAHQRGIRIILDLPLNHTSVEHPWFQASLDPASPYRNWYIWEQQNPGYIGPWGEVVWHPGPSGGYYYGIFWEGMPDLNYRTPEVTAKIKEVFRFWLQDVQVDGFRLDGARYLVEDGKNQADTPETHQLYRELRPYYQELNPQAMTVGEVWTSNYAAVTYVKKQDELDTVFNFDLAASLLASANAGTAAKVNNALKLDLKIYPPGTFATFLANHDQPRVMTQVSASEDKARNAASMQFISPGVPFIYYGEEIGMTGGKPDEDIRTPMQWAADSQAGFTSGQPWRGVKPNHTTANVAMESGSPTSLLSHYRALVALRSQHAALRVGDTYLVTSSSPAVFALLRVSKAETLLALVNLGRQELSDYRLSLEAGPLSGVYRALPVLGAPALLPDLSANAAGGFDVYQPLPSLAGNSVTVIQLK